MNHKTAKQAILAIIKPTLERIAESNEITDYKSAGIEKPQVINKQPVTTITNHNKMIDHEAHTTAQKLINLLPINTPKDEYELTDFSVNNAYWENATTEYDWIHWENNFFIVNEILKCTLPTYRKPGYVQVVAHKQDTHENFIFSCEPKWDENHNTVTWRMGK